MRDLRGWIDNTSIKVIKRIKINIRPEPRFLILQRIVEPTRDSMEFMQMTLTQVLQWAENENRKMSLPDEKYRALKCTKEWLEQLKDTSYKPNTGEVREKASRLLKHYPWSYDIEQGFSSSKRAGVKKTFDWLMKLLDRRVKIKIGNLREQAADLLDTWPTDDMINKAMKQWRSTTAR